MTPQEHFEKAEGYAALADAAYQGNDDETAALASSAGALHATLALAGFTRDAAKTHVHSFETPAGTWDFTAPGSPV